MLLLLWFLKCESIILFSCISSSIFSPYIMILGFPPWDSKKATVLPSLLLLLIPQMESLTTMMAFVLLLKLPTSLVPQDLAGSLGRSSSLKSSFTGCLHGFSPSSSLNHT